MAQPPDANHVNTLGGFHAEHVKDVEHGGATAHERASCFIDHARGKFVSEDLAEDDVRGHGADVGSGEAVKAAAEAEGSRLWRQGGQDPQQDLW